MIPPPVSPRAVLAAHDPVGEDDDEFADAGSAEEAAGEADPGRARPKKAPNAFRTISEVADDLHIPQHVLRFWETKFAQVKPLKRGGGRRYYRPDDISLLRRISDLLYIQGYTIKGVQRLLRESGGKLSDDIPPPAPEERQNEADRRLAIGGPPELPLPEPGPAVGAERRREASAEQLEREVQRLRTVLRGTLVELESLRALLG